MKEGGSELKDRNKQFININKEINLFMSFEFKSKIYFIRVATTLTKADLDLKLAINIY